MVGVHMMVGERLHGRHEGSRSGRVAVWALVAVLAPLWGDSSAVAWGSKAHRLVAAVAESQLDDATKERIADFTGGAGLVPIAMVADQLRASRPETAPWHYVNIPAGAEAYDPQAHCSRPAAGDCVVGAIQRFREQMADSAAPASARADALMFLTHLVADIHQPLHCLGDFRGGNEMVVQLLGERTRPGTDAPWTLHAVWDFGLLEHVGLEDSAYLLRLLRRVPPRASSHPPIPVGTPEEWAMESHRLAVEVAMHVPASGRLDDRYVRRSLRVAEAQLARAGFRLAAILRAAFGDEAAAR